MTTPIGLHPIIFFTPTKDFTATLQQLAKKGQSHVWLTGELPVIKAHTDHINSVLIKYDIRCTVSLPIFNAGIAAWGITIDDFEAVEDLKKAEPSLKIIGLAKDIADAKNFELTKADMVYLGPLDKIGEIPYTTLIPAKPDYEWQFINITIPVCAVGIIDSVALENLCKKVNLFGFAVEIDAYTDLQESDLRFVST